MRSLSARNSPSGKRKIIITSIIVVVILLGVGAYAYFANKQQADDTRRDASTVTEEQAQSGSDKPASQLPPKDHGGSTQPSTTQPSGDSSVTPEKPTIERAGGDPTIKVVATFQKASSGSCELQLQKPGQQTITYTSAITVGASYYMCSFSIPRSALPSGGTWSAVVIHHIGSASTPSDAKEVE